MEHGCPMRITGHAAPDFAICHAQGRGFESHHPLREKLRSGAFFVVARSAFAFPRSAGKASRPRSPQRAISSVSGERVTRVLAVQTRADDSVAATVALG